MQSNGPGNRPEDPPPARFENSSGGSKSGDMMKNGRNTQLQRRSMDADPLKQFSTWYQEAEQSGIPLPNAMTLATSTREGRPSARMVLFKGIDEDGFIFYTNYQSRKSHEIMENPFVSLLFYWQHLSRQIRVEGAVERLESITSDLYFASRPRGSQIEAHASPQSQVVQDREILTAQYNATAQEFQGRVVPRPKYWGGYRIIPESFEFWQEGENRLHDRLRYRRDHAGPWVIERLAP